MKIFAGKEDSHALHRSSLPTRTLRHRVDSMDTNWASDHLQTIRTLMERSALYRRAPAPLLIGVGSIGLAAAVAAWLAGIDSNHGFALFWLAISLGALSVSLLLVRRQ